MAEKGYKGQMHLEMRCRSKHCETSSKYYRSEGKRNNGDFDSQDNFVKDS